MSAIQFDQILDIRPGADLLGTDLQAVEKMLTNQKEQLRNVTVKADVLYTKFIEYFDSIEKKLHNQQGKIACLFAINRAFEFKKLLLKGYIKVADGFYTPTMPDPEKNIKVFLLDELKTQDVNLDFTTLRIPKNYKNTIEYFLFHILGCLEKLFTLWSPQSVTPDVFAKGGELDFNIEQMRAPSHNDPLYNLLKAQRDTLVID